MPALRSVPRHERDRRDGDADRAIVDELAAGLQAAAEERIGRATHTQPLFGCQLHRALPVRAGRRERLLGVDMLARVQRGQVDRRVRRRDGQVHDHVDVGGRNQVLDRHGADAVLLRLGFGPLNHEVGARNQLEAGQLRRVLQVDIADIAAADDADAGHAACRISGSHVRSPFRPDRCSSPAPPPSCRASRCGPARQSATRRCLRTRG